MNLPHLTQLSPEFVRVDLGNRSVLIHEWGARTHPFRFTVHYQGKQVAQAGSWVGAMNAAFQLLRQRS